VERIIRKVREESAKTIAKAKQSGEEEGRKITETGKIVKTQPE
jgi:hypothetical protein